MEVHNIFVSNDDTGCSGEARRDCAPRKEPPSVSVGRQESALPWAGRLRCDLHVGRLKDLWRMPETRSGLRSADSSSQTASGFSRCRKSRLVSSVRCDPCGMETCFRLRRSSCPRRRKRISIAAIEYAASACPARAVARLLVQTGQLMVAIPRPFPPLNHLCDDIRPLELNNAQMLLNETAQGLFRRSGRFRPQKF